MAKTKVSKSGKGCSLEGLGETSILFNHKCYKPNFFPVQQQRKIEKEVRKLYREEVAETGFYFKLQVWHTLFPVQSTELPAKYFRVMFYIRMIQQRYVY